MKKIYFLLTMLLLCAWLHLSAKNNTDIVMISDTHLLAPELTDTSGKAFVNSVASDMRMLAGSDEIMGVMVEKILVIKPKLVCITGDLTKDGELESHRRMVSHLDRLRAAGIATLVVPGNHDMNNPHAVRYKGNETVTTSTVTRNDFAQLYNHYGYGAGTQRDSASLTYACEPIPGLVVIGIDSNRDEENLLKNRGDSLNTYHNAGRIKAQTLRWVESRVRQAVVKGKKVIVLMHHHAVEHFDREANFLSNYVVTNAGMVRERLIKAGVKVIFSGHLHVSDIARNYHDNGAINEVATGSLICYPFHYRTIQLKGDEMLIDTKTIEAIPTNAHLQGTGKARIKKAAPALIDAVTRKAWNKLQKGMDKLQGMLGGYLNFPQKPDAIIKIAHEQCDETAQKALICFLEGNEGKSKESRRLIVDLKTGIEKVFSNAIPDRLADMLQGIMEESVMPEVDQLLKSLLEDRNCCGTEQEVVVDDLQMKLKF